MHRSASNLSHRAGTVLVVVIALAVVGCTTTRSSSDERVAWPTECAETATGLGMLALLVELDRVGPERLRADKEREVDAILRDALEGLPATQVVDGPTLVGDMEAQRWQGTSEHELIERARLAGIDTIGIVSIDRYVGTIQIALIPPGWAAVTDVTYRLRLLDVATSAVVGDVRRQRRTGGYLGIFSGRDTLRRDLKDDVDELLARG